jgi:nucleotide-binding universal stress UspA family protein
VLLDVGAVATTAVTHTLALPSTATSTSRVTQDFLPWWPPRLASKVKLFVGPAGTLQRDDGHEHGVDRSRTREPGLPAYRCERHATEPQNRRRSAMSPERVEHFGEKAPSVPTGSVVAGRASTGPRLATVARTADHAASTAAAGVRGLREGAGRASLEVVIGIEPGDDSEQCVLEQGWLEANSSGRALRAITAWTTLPHQRDRISPGQSAGPTREGAPEAPASTGRLLERGLNGGGLATVVEARRGSSGPVLVQASLAAGLLIVGGRTHNLVAGVFLGSTTEYVLHHAHCPVMIVARTDASGGADLAASSSVSTGSPVPTQPCSGHSTRPTATAVHWLSCTPGCRSCIAGWGLTFPHCPTCLTNG